MTLAVHMVDVFGAGPFSGNPLAVVIGADAMSTDEMQQLTRWFNLSETAFLLPPTHPDADYRVRVFTLDTEMPFAGHPTLGAVMSGSRRDGCRRRRRKSFRNAAPVWSRSGAPTQGELDGARQLLGIEPCDILDAAWIDNGPGWLGIRLASAEKVLSLNPLRNWAGRIDVGVVGPHAKGRDAAFEVRAFFSDHLGAIVEDPVTGSLNASIAQWLFAGGAVEGDYVAAQGTRLGRHGRLHVGCDDVGRIWVGGETRTHVEGRLHGL